MKKYVYLFSEGNKDMRELLGGKGANLCEMTNLGLPVPKGFIVTTEACNNYFDNKRILDKNIENEVLNKIKTLELITNKKVNDFKNPLLLSVRSGARSSMPGMMDSILNIGLNDELAINMINNNHDKKYVYDSYRRLIMMYSDVVVGLDRNLFEKIITDYKKKNKLNNDIEITGDGYEYITNAFLKLYTKLTNKEFPQSLEEQLLSAIKAVFNSWNNERACFYRKLNNIPDEWGTAVNVQEMVYGNLNNLSGTGVAFSRNPETGENKIYGEFMVNAQGEDLVAGIRTPLNFQEFEKLMPKQHDLFVKLAKKLEKHYKDMQDIEFTVENEKLYILQTRNGKRTAKSAIRIAVDLVDEGLIKKQDAIMRINYEDIENSLHKQFKNSQLKSNKAIAKGIAASPGAGSGQIYFNADDAIKANENGKDVILVRNETSPEDIKGMHSANAVVTIRGGKTSHAAVVARGMGKCCVCGCSDAIVDEKKKTITFGNITLKEKDYISVDGTTGLIYKGVIETEEVKFDDYFKKFMELVYIVKKLDIRANAETLADVKNSIRMGAEGIGLARTEHMFFEENKLFHFRKMIVSETEEERIQALNEIKKIQVKDFEKILTSLNGLPFTIRYLDPPLHEFLPKTKSDIKVLAKDLGCTEKKLSLRIEELKEFNPMMGMRGCRLLIKYPEIIVTQTESLIEAAFKLNKKDIKSDIEIMIPLINDVNEFKYVKQIIIDTIKRLESKYKLKAKYKIGTMIELPRACVKADEIAMEADFFSFGTNDLTQMSYGFSRDDSSKFLNEYIDKKIIKKSPFDSLDESGVGELVNIAVQKSKCVKSKIKLGVCGEHGGDPESIYFFHNIGLNYVSCSPYRIPISALAAAKAQIISQNSL